MMESWVCQKKKCHVFYHFFSTLQHDFAPKKNSNILPPVTCQIKTWFGNLNPHHLPHQIAKKPTSKVQIAKAKASKFREYLHHGSGTNVLCFREIRPTGLDLGGVPENLRSESYEFVETIHLEDVCFSLVGFLEKKRPAVPINSNHESWNYV